MKTPEEIKKGILCDCCNDCPYNGCIMTDGGCGQAVTDDTLVYIQQLEAQVPKWVSVEEGLPENDNWVLVCTTAKVNNISKAKYDLGHWRGSGGHWNNVTHWMPLPKPPKENI